MPSGLAGIYLSSPIQIQDHIITIDKLTQSITDLLNGFTTHDFTQKAVSPGNSDGYAFIPNPQTFTNLAGIEIDLLGGSNGVAGSARNVTIDVIVHDSNNQQMVISGVFSIPGTSQSSWRGKVFIDATNQIMCLDDDANLTRTMTYATNTNVSFPDIDHIDINITQANVAGTNNSAWLYGCVIKAVGAKP